MKKFFKIFLIVIISLVVLAYFYLIFPFWGYPFNAQRHGNPPLTPAWALECWLWEDDVNTAAYVDELLEGYKQHDIPVRTIMLDSPWSYRYNDFEIDTALYPDHDNWFLGLQEQGYRVVLWMTSMVNSYNKGLKLEYDETFVEKAREQGFLASDGEENKWWSLQEDQSLIWKPFGKENS